MNYILVQTITFITMFQSKSYANQRNLKGDQRELLPPVEAKHVYPPQLSVQPALLNQQRQQINHPVKISPAKGDERDLLSEETRQRSKGRHSNNRDYKPSRFEYNHQDRHSDGKKGNGGYYKTDSYNGKRGYSTYSSYDQTNKDNYEDSDHNKYGNDREKHGGGGGQYGRGVDGLYHQNSDGSC